MTHLEYEGGRRRKTRQQRRRSIENRPAADVAPDRAIEHGPAHGATASHRSEPASILELTAQSAWHTLGCTIDEHHIVRGVELPALGQSAGHDRRIAGAHRLAIHPRAPQE